MKANPNIKELMQEIIVIYESELKDYREILGLAKKQEELITEGDYQQFNQLITTRAKIINKIDNLEKNLFSYKKSLAQQLGLDLDKDFLTKIIQKELPFGDDLEALIRNIYKRIQDIQELDQKNKEELIIKRNKIQHSMTRVKKGLRVNQAYNTKTTNYEGRFIDKK